MITILLAAIPIALVVSTVSLRALTRSARDASARENDPQYAEQASRWRSLKPEQRRAAVAEVRRGEPISDPETATVALAAGLFEYGPSLATYPYRAMALPATVFGLGAIGIGIAADLTFLVVVGGLLLLSEVWFQLRFATLRRRRDRSRQATQVLHGTTPIA